MSHAQRANRWAVIRRILAAVLIAAAILKGARDHSVGDRLAKRARHFDQRVAQLAAIEFEIILGIWLLIGIALRTWLVTVSAWTIFLFVVLGKAVGGATSCGCFGAMEVNPWITATFDAIAPAALLRFALLLISATHNSRSVAEQQASTFFLCDVIAAACSVIFAAWMVGGCASHHARAQLGRLREELTPEQWVGRALPLFRITSTSRID